MEKNFKNQSVQSKTDQLVRYYKIHSRLSREDALNNVLSKIEKGEKSQVKRQRSIGSRIIGLSVAASITAIITLYFLTANVTIECANGGIASVRLPDNSRVVLHNASEIKYSKYFWNRNLKLDGEAYFEVEKGSRFSVKTKSGSVEVLGTRFLVSENEHRLLVQCFEGKVKTDLKNQSFLLTAGKMVEGKPDGSSTTTGNIADTYPGFAHFSQTFDNAPLTKVAGELGDFFGVEILVNDSAKRKFSGSIETGNLEKALEIVTGSLQLNYSASEKNKIIIQNNN